MYSLQVELIEEDYIKEKKRSVETFEVRVYCVVLLHCQAQCHMHYDVLCTIAYYYNYC